MNSKFKESPVLISAILALLLTALVYVGCWYGSQALAQPFDYLCRIIAKRNWGDWVAIAELFFFWWAMLIITWKWSGRREQRIYLKQVKQKWEDLKRKKQTITFKVSDVSDLNDLVSKLTKAESNSWAGKRLRKAIQRFTKTRVSAQVHDLMTEMSDSSANTNDATYTLIRYCMWFVPTLGFIGTVIGMGMGIAGFGSAILQAGGFDQIKGLLPPITQNLALAFDTTLQALVLVGVLIAYSSYSQREDDKVLDDIDTFCIEEVASSFEDEGLAEKIGGYFRGALVEQTNELHSTLKSIDANTGDTAVGMGEVRTAVHEAAEKTRKEVKDGFQQAAVGTKTIAEQIGRVATSSDQLLSIQNDILGKLGSLDDHAAGIQEEVKSQTLLGWRQVEATEKGAAELIVLKEACTSAAQSLEKAIRESSDAGVLKEALKELSNTANGVVARFEQSFDSLQKNITAKISDLTKAFAEMQGQFGHAIGGLDKITTTLQEFIEKGGVQEAGEFTKAVTELVVAVRPLPDAVARLGQASEGLKQLEKLAAVAEALGSASAGITTAAKSTGDGAEAFKAAGSELKDTISSNREALNGVKDLLGQTRDSIQDLRENITSMSEVNIKLLAAIQKVADAINRRSI